MWLSIAIASTVWASADTIPFSSGPLPATKGIITTGEPWQYNAIITRTNPEDSWGSPGAGQGSVPWDGLSSVTSFEITFDLPSGAAIDAGAPRFGFNSIDGANTYAWIPTLISSSAILFIDPSGDPALDNTQSYFVNIYFTGDVTNSRFTGAWDASTASSPEPSSLLLMAAGILGMGLARRQLNPKSRFSARYRLRETRL